MIMKRSRTSTSHRISALALVLLMLADTCFPTFTMALTGGPSQPELTSFTPIGMNNMVNLATGDFSYNIPLMTVPGPGGGYPLNIAYQAGVSMEQEASWVGLGWNINPGVINRTVRGLPDDFDGQEVVKEMAQRPNRTFSANLASKDIEALGADLSKISKGLGLKVGGNINFIYNNYNGWDVKAGLGFSLVETEQQANANDPKKDPQDSTKKVTFSFADRLKQNMKDPERNKNIYNDKTERKDYFYNVLNTGITNLPAGMSFAGSGTGSSMAYDFPRETNAFGLNVKVGLTFATVTKDIQVDVFYSQQSIQDRTQKMPAYGYLHTENKYRNGQGKALLDLSREKESLITPESRYLPIPQYTYDLFHVKAQGLSGNVRPHRGGISVLTDPESKSSSNNYGAGVELNFGPTETKVGVNPRASFSRSYAGNWRSGNGSLFHLYNGFTQEEEHPLHEPYYFQFSEDLTASTLPENGPMNVRKPTRFKLDRVYENANFRPRVKNTLSGKGYSGSLGPSNSFRFDRERRAKHFSFLTEKETNDMDRGRRVYDLATSSWQNVAYTTSNTPEGRAMGEITVLDEAGKRYVYGIPAHNNEIYERTFSVKESNAYQNTASPYDKEVNYASGDDSPSNDKGTDHFYSSTKTPKHAHSFLLTEVLSDDYVDADATAGPSPGDLGDYVKFEYAVTRNYRSRSPLNNANLLPGKLSNSGDDKASYRYVDKDAYYLKSIETKTHIAVFELENREDARGATNINGGAAGKVSKRLRRIHLYNRDAYVANPSTAEVIKTVEFDYDYSLCPGVTNNPNSNGKLTLKKIRFKKGSQNTKVTLSPYEFTYETVNPAYNGEFIERWGNYQPVDSNAFGSNLLFPYVNQDRAIADHNARAWNLKTIKLPSGGTITVDYEADDYGYVQDKKAMQMVEIAGFGNTTSSLPTQLNRSYLNNNYNRMYVKLPAGVTTQAQVEALFAGVTETFYKAFIRQKTFPQGSRTKPSNSLPFNDAGTACDYVEGYVKLVPNTAVGFASGGGAIDYASVQVNMQNAGDHPMKKSAWVNLRNRHQDLLDDSGLDLSAMTNLSSSIINTIVNFVNTLINLSQGDEFFKKCRDNNWCNRISFDLPSLLRVNAVNGTKVGGGHRVKRITLSDGWNSMYSTESSFSYGKEYTYETVDGTTSGVAQYEPIAEGEEIPHRLPVRYSTDRLLIKDDYMYTEMPIGESFYPSPQVGYSRVVVESLSHTGVTLSGTGVQVHEFYTAKDYPVKATATDMNSVNTSETNKFLRLLGGKSYFEPGFSQGYYIELNNMHGQQKAVSTYRGNADLQSDQPVSRMEYYYSTEGGYREGSRNYLDNEVGVLLDDGHTENRSLGEQVESYADLRESSTESISGDLTTNMSVLFFLIPIPLPTVFPNIDYSHKLSRTVVFNKVVTKNGILEKVVEYKNGGKTTKENLYYDSETGTPLLTSVTNNFDQPIYTYRYAGHWNYPRMGGAYINQGATIPSGTDSQNGAGAVLTEGDEILAPNGDRYWVHSSTYTQGTGVLSYTFKNESNSSVTTIPAGSKVVRSAYQNKQAAQTGLITMLQNPIDEIGTSLQVLNEYNQQSWGTPVSNQLNFTYDDCIMGSTQVTAGYTFRALTSQGTFGHWILVPIRYDYDPVTGQFYWYYDPQYVAANPGLNPQGQQEITLNTVLSPNRQVECGVDQIWVTIAFPINYQTDARAFQFYPLGNGLVRAVNGSEEVICTMTYEFGSGIGCEYSRCYEGVLEAVATTFSDRIPRSKEGLSSTLQTAISNNPYRYAEQGRFRPYENYMFPVIRQQSITNPTNFAFQTRADRDGELDVFYPFQWSANNPAWTDINRITRFDYAGNEIENQSALDIYSAAMFGYNKTLPIAIAQNAPYAQIAYDGFEDYPTTGYTTTNSDNHIAFPSNVQRGNKGTAHTGDYALELNNAQALSSNLTFLQANEKYVASVWIEDGTASGAQLEQGATDLDFIPRSPNIDGWRLYELIFTASGNEQIRILGEGKHFDDIRIQPFHSSMRTFVYSPTTHQLVAELDENNFATLYNYDEDQELVQVKKETSRGIKTIQRTQSVNRQP